MRVHVSSDVAMANIEEAIVVFKQFLEQETDRYEASLIGLAKERAKKSWFNKDVNKHLTYIREGDLNAYIDRLRLRNETNLAWAEARLKDAEYLRSKFALAMRLGEPVIFDNKELELLSISLDSAKDGLK